jgi:hypothetical protein
MEKAVAYCAASHTLSELAREERARIGDKQATRNYHMQALSDELKQRAWAPLRADVNGETVFVIARVRKVYKPFTLDDVLARTHLIGSLTADSERSIDDVVAEFVLSEFTDEVPCGARITRKVGESVQRASEPLRTNDALRRVLELDEELKQLREPYRTSRKPHQKTKRLLETDLLQAVGDREESVDTTEGSYKLKCRAQTKEAKFSAKDVARAVKAASASFVEDHSLDERASSQTVSACQSEDFTSMLRKQLSEAAEETGETTSKSTLQCVRS